MGDTVTVLGVVCGQGCGARPVSRADDLAALAGAGGGALGALYAVGVRGLGRHARKAGPGAGTSIAAAVIAFVAPRDGADAVIGAELASFAQTVQCKVLDNCMTSDGFCGAPVFAGGGPRTDLGNPQFPNLPAIEASHDLGLFTGGRRPFVESAGRHERARAQGVAGADRPLLQDHAGADPAVWLGEVRTVELGLVQRREPGQSVGPDPGAEQDGGDLQRRPRGAGDLGDEPVRRLQQQLGPIQSSSADSTKVQQLQAKGASVLATCWAKVINETTALLSGRRAAYLAQNASAVAALQSQVDGQVTSVERRYGIKLTLGGS